MKKLSVFIVLIALCLSMSCVLAVVDSRHPERLHVSLSQFNRSLPLKTGGSIFLENTSGDISIEGWDEENVEVVVEENTALPRSPQFYFLGQRHPQPKIQVEHSEDEIRMRTPPSEKEKDDRLFDYQLKVPRSVNFREIRNGEGDIQISGIYGSAQISAKGGSIKVRNFSGPLGIELESGDVEAELLDLQPQDEVVIMVNSGDITLYLEPGIGAELEARAPAGDVSSEFDIVEPLPAKTVAAKLGEGGARISLTARRGDVKLMRAEE